MYRKIMMIFVGIVLLVTAALFFVQKEEKVRLLVVTNGQDWDRAAYYNFKQSYIVNAVVEQYRLDELEPRQLKRYDALYLDVSIAKSELLPQWSPSINQYVHQGGHLFVENQLAAHLDSELLGASQIVDIQAPDKPQFSYPEAAFNIRPLQRMFALFTENFENHIGFASLPGFNWGKGMIPSTAQPLVNLDGVAIVALNHYGKGSVLTASSFLPNRYFITGFDLQSGLDDSQGFRALAKQINAKAKTPGVAFFAKQQIEQEPYFHFAFATANLQFRNEFLAYVAKTNIGYSIKKVLGPYGRPAMAYQNHFEALPAFRDNEGIQWAELLKRHKQIPSFSLVRGAFDWGTWKESIVVHLNVGTTDKPQFIGEFPNSFYTSGTHVISDKLPLQQAIYPDYRSLADPLEQPYRAYPAAMDWNKDGRMDIMSGSADGFIYVYPNIGADQQVYAGEPKPASQQTPDAFGKAQKVALTTGEWLHTGTYSTLAVVDLNDDKESDLILGTPSGQLLVALNDKTGQFQPLTTLLADGKPIQVASHAAPAVGDINGDKIADLVVGDGEGQITIFNGMQDAERQLVRFQAGSAIIRLPAKFAAPSIIDMNQDDKNDLVIGSSEGNLQLYLQELDRWIPNGSISGETHNQIGNKVLVGGHYSVPLWWDLNHDGQLDLVVGQVEYGMPITLDDARFPYKKQLAEFIQYAKDNHLELYPHLFFHNYVSNEQEKQEIELHRQAFAALGLPWKYTGTNQHTWRINNADRLQSLRNENAADIWFNFGFKPSFVPSDPQWGQDFIWGLPFLLEDDQLRSPMLIYTPAPTLRIGGKYSSEDIYRSFVEQDMPINYFEHIEYHFPNRVNELQQFVDYFDDIRNEYDYNFMTEPQMARSFLANLGGKVEISTSWGVYLWDRIKDKFGKGKHLTVNLKPIIGNETQLAEKYRNTIGVVVEPGKTYRDTPLATNSDIFMQKDERLYIGLPKAAKLRVDWKPQPMHIVRANVPIQLTKEPAQWTIHLNDAGMQQVKLYSPTPLIIEGTDLTIEQNPEMHTYTVTHFGDRTSITVKY